MTAGGLEPFSRASRAQTVSFLARRPYENVYLQWLVESGATAYHDDALMLWREESGAIRGVACFGAQIVIAADDDRALDAFAHALRRYPPARTMVGPRPQIDRFWERIAGWHRAPTLVRERQWLYVVSRERLAPISPVDVRPARLDESAVVIEHSAAMIVGELGYDPRENRFGFAAGVRNLIERGWWWVLMNDRELQFTCNVGSRTDATTQVQGVWTPSQLRGRGIATSALGSIVDRLLERSRTVSLYVNDFNEHAIALYERLGFERAGEFATYLFA